MRFKSKFQNRVNDRKDRKDRKSLCSLPKIGQQTIKALLKEREWHIGEEIHLVIDILSD